MSKRTIWALVVVGAILLWVSASYGLPPHEICEAAKPGQSDCASYGLPRYLLVEVARYIENHTDLILALSGTAVAAFTGVLWWSTDKLWQSSRAELTHSENTAKRQLRAYLYVELKEAPKLEVGCWPDGSFWLRNGGQTPAHKVYVANGFTIGKYPFEGDPPPIPDDAFDGGGHHAPNTSTVLRCKAKEGGITQPWIDAINEGTRRIVMYGEIRYEDVFGEAHFTKYRAEFGGPETANGDFVIWAPKGNEAD